MALNRTLVSDQDIWSGTGGSNGISAVWSGATLNDSLPDLQVGIHAAAQTNQLLATAPSDVGGQITLGCTLADWDEMYDRWITLKMFADSIHYETAEWVDVPFTGALGPVADAVYELSPKDFRTKKNFLVFKRGQSLEDLLLSVIDDPALRTSFQQMVKGLDEDAVSDNIREILADAEFWASEFDKAAEIRDLAEQFILDNEAEWAGLPADVRKDRLEQYAIEVGKILDNPHWSDFFTGKGNILKNVYWISEDNPSSTANGYTYSQTLDGNIYINDGFGTNDNPKYFMYKALNTTTHEVRHQYQARAVDDPVRYATPVESLNDWFNPIYNADYWTKPIEEDARGFAALAGVTP